MSFSIYLTPRHATSMVARIVYDYDCFYASVFEAEQPALKSLPLAVQQKQIVVTCNYEARRRGLRKLQLIKDAKRICPDVVVVLGEDLTKFRDASKELYAFLKEFVVGCGWEKRGRMERLGFDEVFLDVTPIIDYNIDLLNQSNLSISFFHLHKTDPTVGFTYDARAVVGPTFPHTFQDSRSASCCPTSNPNPNTQTTPYNPDDSYPLYQRLILASHLANYIRHQLEEHKGYTATVGISTSKLLAKLAGTIHKPRNQTTLLPPYDPPTGSNDDGQQRQQQQSNVTFFLDTRDISAVPGIGFKIAQKLRTHILRRAPETGIYEELARADRVTVRDVRLYPGMGPSLLEEILLSGSGSSAWPRDIGMKIWRLINGIDPSPVAEARAVPTQISIEDSYGRGMLDGVEVVKRELARLGRSLLRRMLADLMEEEVEDEEVEVEVSEKGTDGGDGGVGIERGNRRSGKRRRRWLAHPRTLRLSTRARLPPLPDGSPDYGGGRASRSCPMPGFVFSALKVDAHGGGDTVAIIDAVANRLAVEILLPLFRKLHPGRPPWDLCVVNIAVTNIVESGLEGNERDIGEMFKSQGRAVGMVDGNKNGTGDKNLEVNGDVDIDMDIPGDDAPAVDEWDSDDDEDMLGLSNGDGDGSSMMSECAICGALMPHFAIGAHGVFHAVPD
ncbi:hypothetical protein AJ79_06285 [Helicocarpus griseus UAMH5409]|uniref:UmuC domain-containing protein n=1 Tax=Helicocarpus griseus UAMH5409 TaxID=1447875 RepID=A0A2B7XF66_9EURO|nr:hypothetical protein AJ79_06285 [Helicocarpus griseus UAMH5409]